MTSPFEEILLHCSKHFNWFDLRWPNLSPRDVITFNELYRLLFIYSSFKMLRGKLLHFFPYYSCWLDWTLTAFFTEEIEDETDFILVTIPAGSTSTTFTLTTEDDTVRQGNRTVFLVQSHFQLLPDDDFLVTEILPYEQIAIEEYTQTVLVLDNDKRK